MTDRVQAFVVILERDTREDDAETLKQTIRMLRGVVEVHPDIVDVDTITTRARIRMETGELVGALLHKVIGQ